MFLPACKEVHYFSLHADKDPSWYANHYRPATPGQCCGDITPYYLFHPEAPARIRRLLPNAKLIVLLRDPVDRVLSQYFHSLQLGLEDLPLEEALGAEAERLAGAERELRRPGARHRSHQEHSYLARSRYGGQLSRYEAVFARSHILLLRSEDLFSRPRRVWKRLQRFLGLKVMPLPEVLRANASEGNPQAVPQELLEKLRGELLPTYGLMKRCYGMNWDRGMC